MENFCRFVFDKNPFIAFCVYFNWSFSAENHVRELKQKWWYVLLKPHSSAVGLQGYPTVGISITISLSKNVFKEHTSTQSGLFEFLFSGFAQMFRQVVPVRRVTLTHLQYKVGNVQAIRQGMQKMTRPQFRLTCVAEKRLCLNSLMFSTGRLGPEVQPLTLLNNSYDRKGTWFE